MKPGFKKDIRCHMQHQAVAIGVVASCLASYPDDQGSSPGSGI